jgi:Proteasome subunit A N-terminal signature
MEAIKMYQSSRKGVSFSIEDVTAQTDYCSNYNFTNSTLRKVPYFLFDTSSNPYIGSKMSSTGAGVRICSLLLSFIVFVNFQHFDGSNSIVHRLQYDQSLTYSPDGKIYQVEYSFKAFEQAG